MSTILIVADSREGEALRVGAERQASVEPSHICVDYLSLGRYTVLVSIFLKLPTRIYNHLFPPRASHFQRYLFKALLEFEVNAKPH